jgi:hypothetical protein
MITIFYNFDFLQKGFFWHIFRKKKKNDTSHESKLVHFNKPNWIHLEQFVKQDRQIYVSFYIELSFKHPIWMLNNITKIDLCQEAQIIVFWMRIYWGAAIELVHYDLFMLKVHDVL